MLPATRLRRRSFLFHSDGGGTQRGDIDLDGDVDFADFFALSANFGATDAVWSDGDLDGDGTVAFADFLILSQNFGFKRNA